jgi:FixJ family two-component response regulator
MSLPPRHIAVLDDDLSVRNAIRRLLEASGLRVTCHSTGMQLLAAMEAESPDCLVLDLQMPGMSGTDILHYLDHIDARLPIIIITAHDDVGSPDLCLAAGATAYLRKPLDAEELLLAIDDAVRRFALAHVDQGPIEP